MTKQQKLLLTAVVLPIEIVLAVRAWQDLATRSDDQVRGSKKLWKVFFLLNPGNALLYWLFGRR